MCPKYRKKGFWEPPNGLCWTVFAQQHHGLCCGLPLKSWVALRPYINRQACMKAPLYDLWLFFWAFEGKVHDRSTFDCKKSKSVDHYVHYLELHGVDFSKCPIKINFNSPLLPQISEFMEKTFQAAQLTHEIFLTLDHSYKIFFCQNELPECWCVVLYYTTHQRSVEVQFGSYQKIFCRSDLWSKFSHVLVVQLEMFYP